MIGSGTTVRGSISGEEDLMVEGNVEGSIRITKDLTIGKSATVDASVEAQNLAVDGTLNGSAVIGTMLTVANGATVVGDVTTPRISIADGAHFQGHINMDFEIPPVD
jgi:cytoskeletal protein CcmA (bactofilin family)